MFPTIPLLILDALVLSISLGLAYIARNLAIITSHIQYAQPSYVYKTSLPFAILIMWVVFYFSKLYEKKTRITAFNEITQIVFAQSLVMVLVMAGSYLVKYDFSRFIVLSVWIASIIILVISRSLFRKFEIFVYKQGIAVVNVAVIGTNIVSKKIKERILQYKNLGYYFKGFISLHENQTLTLFPNEKNEILGAMGNLKKIISKHNLNEIYFPENSEIDKEKIMLLALKCRKTKVRFKITSREFNALSPGMHLDQTEGIPSFDVSTHSLSIYNEIIKRIFDILASSALLIALCPFFIVIATMIKRDSKGPVFFKQKRAGRFEKTFTIYKFRTLATVGGPKQVTKNDARITSIGKWLRRFSLDELPQLINIIKGDMSLVGPRPELVEIVETYKKWHHVRHQVKPGLTGLWQILGRKDLPLIDNIEYDLYYIQKQSFLLDLIILIKRIPKIFTAKGAY